MNEPSTIARMLGEQGPTTLAVVGLSDNPARPSHSVSAYMQSHGYRILPVNPLLAGQTVLGEPVYASLADLPARPDVVNVFRLPKFVHPIVEEMIALGLPDLWVQLGIRNLEAAALAESHNIGVVMDRCILIEHRRLGLA